MNTTVGNYIIETRQANEKGMPWIVRLQRKRLLLNKHISTDWFLDKNQADLFARQLAEQFRSNAGEENMKKRKPGWTLTRPIH
ncbi:MAG: hypothetical protein KF749_02515 [Bacteroidetes bacterium]|nr:hypothetical protein [Bacteroidota bacterium]MCW5897412.1 hypothetical protein [Bacteroidota bacterium]